MMSTRNSKEEMRELASKTTREANRNANEYYRKSISGNQTGCFPASTRISVPKGEVAIKDIKVGSKVTSIDVAAGHKQGCNVLKILKYRSENIVSIKFADATSLRATPSHSFRVGQNWMQAKNLCVGDRIAFCAAPGGLMSKVIASVETTIDPQEVYNLITDAHHNFIADGAIVHNFTYFRKVRMLYWRAVGLLQNVSLFGNWKEHRWIKDVHGRGSNSKTSKV